MSRGLVLRPEAEADALEAYRWYNEQLPGLGEEFLAEVDRALETIRANPETPRKLHREFRRVLTRRFPYAVFYATLKATESSYSPLFTRRGILDCGGNVAAMPRDKSLQRTSVHRGRPVLAMDGVLAGAERASHLAAELNR